METFNPTELEADAKRRMSLGIKESEILIGVEPKHFKFEDDRPDKYFIRGILTKRSGLSIQHTAVESPSYDPDDKWSMRDAINIFFQNLSYVLQKEYFPEHTMTGDVEILENGSVRITNPHYPDEEPISSPTTGEENQETKQ